MRTLAERGRALSDAQTAVARERDELLASLPNLPAAGRRARGHRPARGRRGTKTGKDHLELAGERIDMERGARLSGARFAYLRGDLVLLELALVRYALEKLGGEGFEPVIPPVLVREQALFGTGMLPDTEQQIYHLPDDDLYLVGTSEVALASLHAGEILDGEDAAAPLRRLLPMLPPQGRRGRQATRAGSSACTSSTRSRCSASSRRRTRRPSTSGSSRSRSRSCGELEIPYRVVNIAVGRPRRLRGEEVRLRGVAARAGPLPRADLRSNTTDYQARRLEIRYRPKDAKKPETLHTLNGTAVAVGRTLIALLENGQQDDGSIVIPPALVAAGAPPQLAAA